jgi:hypothetical protein
MPRNASSAHAAAPSQQRFDDAGADAVGAVRGLWLIAPLGAAACALLAFLGIRARLEEYR